MILLDLFLSFIKVGLFSIGGGYAAMPIIKSQVVDSFHWISMSEFTDLITIAEMTPGPIAVNSATFVGIRIAGVPGAIIATAGCILPSIFIVSILVLLYFKYRKMDFMTNILSSLRPVVVAMIASAGLSILISVVFNGAVILENANYLSLLLFMAALIGIRKFKLKPILTMFACGIIYTIINCLFII